MKWPWEVKDPPQNPEYEYDTFVHFGDYDCDHITETVWGLSRNGWTYTNAERCVLCGMVRVRSHREVRR